MPENGTGSHFGSHFAGSDGPSHQPNWGAPIDEPAPSAPVARPAIPEVDGAGMAALGESATPEAVSESTAAALDTLAPGEGAVVTTRDTAAEAADAARSTFQEMGTGSMRLSGMNRPQVRSKREGSGISGKVIGIAIALAAILLVVGMFVVRGILNGDNNGGGEGSLIERTQVNVSDPIEYGGYTYQVSELPDKSYQLTRLAAGASEPLVIADLEGTPVTVILENGVFYIPENTSAGWDIIAYMMGDGSVPSKLVDTEGNEITGTGTITAAEVQGSELVVSTEDGQTQRIPIAF